MSDEKQPPTPLAPIKKQVSKIFNTTVTRLIALGTFVALLSLGVYFLSVMYRGKLPSNRKDAIYALIGSIGVGLPVFIYLISSPIEYKSFEEVNQGLNKQKFTSMIINLIKLVTVLLLAVRLWFFYKPKAYERAINIMQQSLHGSGLLHDVWPDLMRLQPKAGR